MFDFRYHALSLAAVLFALALGVLLGVAIGDSNLVSSAKNGIVHNLESEVSSSHDQADKLQQRLTSEEAFANGLYPLAVHELLSQRSIGLVFLGEASNQVNSLVRAAVTQAGGNLATVIAVREPLDLTGIAQEAAGTHDAPLAESSALVESFGDLAGRQLVSGGQLVDKELLSRVRSSLLSAFDGQLTRLEGVVVMRAEPTGMTAAQTEDTAAFESGPACRHRHRGRPRGWGGAERNRRLAGALVQGQGHLQRRRSRRPRRAGRPRLRPRRGPWHLRSEVHRRLPAADRHHQRSQPLSASARAAQLPAMHALPFLLALAGALLLAPALLRTLAAGGHTRPNYRRRALPFPFGVLTPAVALLALIPLMLLQRLASTAIFHAETLPVALYVLGVLALGLIDDTLAPPQAPDAAGQGTPAPVAGAATARPSCAESSPRGRSRPRDRSAWRCWR